jgi:hypothetical protein
MKFLTFHELGIIPMCLWFQITYGDLRFQVLFCVDIDFLSYVYVSFVARFGTQVCVVFVLQVFGLEYLCVASEYVFLCLDAMHY